MLFTRPIYVKLISLSPIVSYHDYNEYHYMISHHNDIT